MSTNTNTITTPFVGWNKVGNICVGAFKNSSAIKYLKYAFGLLSLLAMVGCHPEYKQQFADLRSKAEEGISWAQYDLGLMYAQGQGTEKNQAEAVKWFRKAADKGDDKAQEFFKLMYDVQGVAKSEVELIKAAEQGNVEAQYKLGRMFDNGWYGTQSNRKAEKWYRKAAEQGNALAQYYLGRITEDKTKALKWYRMSAEQGNTEAQYEIGNAYSNGRGVAPNNAEAMKWYLKAAEQGNTNAQYHLGWMYNYGHDVTKNETEALAWYYVAESNGCMYQMDIHALEKKLGREGTTQAQERARQLYQKQTQPIIELHSKAESGDAKAQYDLGKQYADGRNGVIKNEAEAMNWFLKAADQGSAEAQCEIAYMYRYGYGVAKDGAEAAKWYHKAADKGYAKAQYELGYIYRWEGSLLSKDWVENLEKNKAEAAKLFRLAAAQGNEKAQSELNKMGYGSDNKDRSIAIGMESYRVRARRGEPTEINKTVTAYGVREQWIYRGYGSFKDTYLYFTDDKLTSWQE